jgi:lysine 6-dehydrogenase
MRALVPGGVGAVCKETTRDLAKFSDFEEIVVADYNLEAAQALVKEIGDPRLRAIFFDANDHEEMLRLFPDYDIVVNGLPFKYNYSVAQACVQVGVNGMDLAGDDPQFALHEKALEKDILYIPGMGATPGITNMMVLRAAEMLDRIDAVDIFFAAFRCLAPAPGLLQTTLWEFNPDEADRTRVYYEEGIRHAAPPMSGERMVQFGGQIGEQPVYHVPHDESKTLPLSFPSLRRAAVRGCFPPQVMALMGALMRGGLLSSRSVRVDGTELPAIEVVRRLLADAPASQENLVWGYGLVVEVTGEQGGRRTTCTYRSQHPPQEKWGGQAAYFKNVGIPLSIAAQLVAHGQAASTGVLPPEQALPTQPFFTELARRGIEVEEIIVNAGSLV